MRGAGARTLMFLHGWGTSGRYFDWAVDHLDLNAVRAITVDLRGHGDSEKPDVALTWDLLAADVLAVADDAGADRFVAVGHSLGGKLSQYLVLVEPRRLEALVLVASPSAGPLEAPGFVRAWVELAGDGRALVEDSVRRFLRVPVAEEILERLAQEAATIPRIYLDRTLELVAQTSFLERLGTPRLPVLILSTDDPVHATERDIVKSFPLARMETLTCGGEIPVEQPAEFVQAMTAFLATLTPAR